MEENKKVIIKKVLEEKKQSIKEEKKELKETNKKKVKEPKKKHRKRRCLNCREWFYPSRLGQVYCSDKCSSNKRNEKALKKYHEEKDEENNKLTPCNTCKRIFPKWSLNKNGNCAKCESRKKVCKFCGEEYNAKRDEQEFCGLRCAALHNQKKGLESRTWPQFDLQEILSDLIPLLQYDCTLEEACNQTGWSFWTIKNYLYWNYNLDEFPEILEFRKQIKKAMQYIKIIARKTLVEAVVTKKDVNSAKYIISNRDKRYQGGLDENGDNPTKKVVFKFDIEPSPFIQPKDAKKEVEKEYGEEDIEVE